MDDRSVLVVEEDPGIRELIVELLADAGYEVLEATHGSGGLHLAEVCSPSLIVVNHWLPDMSGVDMLAHLRRRPRTRDISTILVSGRLQQLDVGASGADRVLPLPFDIDVLLTHVEQLARVERVAVA